MAHRNEYETSQSQKFISPLIHDSLFFPECIDDYLPIPWRLQGHGRKTQLHVTYVPNRHNRIVTLVRLVYVTNVYVNTMTISVTRHIILFLLLRKR